MLKYKSSQTSLGLFVGTSLKLKKVKLMTKFCQLFLMLFFCISFTFADEGKEHLPQADLKLNLLKTKHYAPMPVELDASKSSGKKGATIVKYEFDFGDGSAKKVVTIPLVKHTFEILPESSLKFWKKNNNEEKQFKITLRVLDSTGVWSEPNEKTLVLKQIPDPGEKGKETLAGIDLDEDGIRDDVQLYIAQKFKDEKPIVRQALREYGKSLQAELLSADNKEISIMDSFKAIKANGCLWYLTQGKQEKFYKDILGVTMNTKIRVVAEIKADKNFDGQTWEVKSGEEAKSDCNFNLSDF